MPTGTCSPPRVHPYCTHRSRGLRTTAGACGCPCPPSPVSSHPLPLRLGKEVHCPCHFTDEETEAKSGVSGITAGLESGTCSGGHMPEPLPPCAPLSHLRSWGPVPQLAGVHEPGRRPRRPVALSAPGGQSPVRECHSPPPTPTCVPQGGSARGRRGPSCTGARQTPHTVLEPFSHCAGGGAPWESKAKNSRHGGEALCLEENADRSMGVTIPGFQTPGLQNSKVQRK